MSYPSVPPRHSRDDLTVHMENDIAAPISTVFEVLEDLELFAGFEANTTSVTYTSKNQRGLGVRSHWTGRDPETGDGWESDEEIVHYDKPHQYAYVGHSRGRDYAGVHTLSENPDGTTHHEFNEVFHFDADPSTYETAVAQMVANAKREAERRHADPTPRSGE